MYQRPGSQQSRLSKRSHWPEFETSQNPPYDNIKKGKATPEENRVKSVSEILKNYYDVSLTDRVGQKFKTLLTVSAQWAETSSCSCGGDRDVYATCEHAVASMFAIRRHRQTTSPRSSVREPSPEPQEESLDMIVHQLYYYAELLKMKGGNVKETFWDICRDLEK